MKPPSAGVVRESRRSHFVHDHRSRAPEYVGGTGTYDFQVSGDTLVLTDVDIVSFDNVPVPGFAATGRYHQTLVRLRGPT